MDTLIVVGLIAIVVVITFNRLINAEAKPETTLQVFTMRRIWKKFPSEFLEALAEKLKSVENAKEFVVFCENTGILDNNIVKIVHEEPGYALGSAAATLTSYANAMGERQKFHQAKRSLEFALLLRPRNVVAWMSMALVMINLNDCHTAVMWADKVLNFKPDPNSDDPWEAGVARAMTSEGAQYAAEVIGDTEIVGGFNEIQKQMKAIKEMCHDKS